MKWQSLRGGFGENPFNVNYLKNKDIRQIQKILKGFKKFYSSYRRFIKPFI